MQFNGLALRSGIKVNVTNLSNGREYTGLVDSIYRTKTEKTLLMISTGRGQIETFAEDDVIVTFARC
jgi:hypothetical protein